MGQIQDLRLELQKEAKEDDAARTGGSPLRLRGIVHPIFRGKFKAVLDALIAEWSLLGLELEIEELALADFGQLQAAAATTDLVLTRWYPDYRDPDAYFSPTFKERGGFYGSFLATPELEKQIDAAKAATGSSQRERLYRRLQRILIHQDLLLPLFHEVEFRVASPAISDLELTAHPPYIDYRKIGWRSEQAPTLEAPRRLGRLRLPLPATLDTLDLSRSVDFAGSEALSAVFEGLTRLDPGGAVVPNLAKSLERSADGLSYRIRLRDALFHDGRRVRVQDVRATLQRALRHGHPAVEKRLEVVRGAAGYQARLTEELSGFEVLSEHTFVLHLERPVAHFPVILSHPALAIVPEGTRGLKGTWREGCVGTGPFMVVDFEPGRRLELAAHERYWRSDMPSCQSLLFERPSSPTDLAADLASGHFHVVRELSAQALEGFAANSRFAGGMVEHPAFATFFLALNRVQGPLADVETRRLLCRHVAAVQEEALGHLGRTGIHAHGLIPPGLLPAGSRVPPSWVGESAPTMDDLHLEIAVNPLLLGQYESYWRALREGLVKRGIKLEVVCPDVESMVERARLRSLDLIAGRWSADLPDASSFANILHSDIEPFGRLVSHERIDRLVERGAAEDDPAARQAAYGELERQIAVEALIWPLFHQQICCVADPHVRGLRLGFGWPMVSYGELSLRS